MRKIERLMNDAINREIDWQQDNTSVQTSDGISDVYLHGNLIAKISETWVQLFDGGHQSKTTKSRLNAILSVHGNGERVYAKNFDWFVSTNEGAVPFTEGMRLV